MADNECMILQKAYGQYDWAKNVRVLYFGSSIGLVMPHFCAIPVEYRQEAVGDVRRSLKSCFYDKGLRYSDLKWHHIMRFRDSSANCGVVVDMGECVYDHSRDDRLVEDQISILKNRIRAAW